MVVELQVDMEVEEVATIVVVAITIPDLQQVDTEVEPMLMGEEVVVDMEAAEVVVMEAVPEADITIQVVDTVLDQVDMELVLAEEQETETHMVQVQESIEQAPIHMGGNL